MQAIKPNFDPSLRPKLQERLSLPEDERREWLFIYDAYLIAELTRIFKDKLYIRGHPHLGTTHQGLKINAKFAAEPEVDYIIYSEKAATGAGLKLVEKSRILYYRPSKTYGYSRTHDRSFFRPVGCRFVRLKKQVLTIFEEEMGGK